MESEELDQTELVNCDSGDKFLTKRENIKFILGYKQNYQIPNLITEEYNKILDECPANLKRQISSSIQVPLLCDKITDCLSTSMSPSTSYLASGSTSHSYTQSRPRTCSLSSRRLSDKLSSPMYSLTPRVLRNSFYKFIRKGLISTRSSSNDDIVDHDSILQSSTISPIMKEIVKDSEEKGLPIIPFASKKFPVEKSKKETRENPLKSLDFQCSDRENSDGITEEPTKMNNINTTKHPYYSKSSYVEMDPADANISRSCHRPDNWDENPYMNYKEETMEGDIFHMEETGKSKTGNTQYCAMGRKQNDTNSYKSVLENGFQPLVEDLGTKYRKGKRHKDDYVFLDFEHNKQKAKKEKKSPKWTMSKFSTTTKHRY